MENPNVAPGTRVPHPLELHLHILSSCEQQIHLLPVAVLPDKETSGPACSTSLGNDFFQVRFSGKFQVLGSEPTLMEQLPWQPDAEVNLHFTKTWCLSFPALDLSR